MAQPLITLIAAQGKNRVIGDGEKMLWHLPEDLKFFKQKTLGKPVIMGRKTWNTIGGKPLPGRPNIVITHERHWKAAGAMVVHSLDHAWLAAETPDVDEIMVIGGGTIYRQALPFAGRIYLTEVDCAPEGAVQFPALSMKDWQEVWQEAHPADKRHLFAYTFRQLERQYK